MMNEDIPAIYESLCPICNSDLSTEEIQQNLCFNKHKPLDESELKKLFEKYSDFFCNISGKELRTLQRLWAKRILQNKSFAAISPTGIGKSFFGLVTSLWFASQKEKSYILVPTTLLVQSFYEKINQLNKINAKIIAYHSDLKSKEKKEFLEKVEKQDFDVIITTISFFSKNYQLIKNINFKFIFVDDIDAVLKNSRNITKLISLVKDDSILMVSSATAKIGKSAKKFREKLGFSIGSHRNLVRNVIDLYRYQKNLDYLKEILNKVKDGALIFTHTIEEAKKLYEELKKDYAIGLAVSENKEMFQDFKDGKLNFLIGVAAPYGALIRGLDLPERIKFAIFYGIPHHKFTLQDIENYDENKILILANLFEETRKLSKKYSVIKNPQQKEKILKEIKETLKEKIQKAEFDRKDVLLENGEVYIPDLTSYIQGSGRTSRLYGGGLLLGVSIVLDEEKFIEALKSRVEFYNIELQELEIEKLDDLVIKVENDRKKKINAQSDFIKQKLLIVESPTKAKIIAGFFGKPNLRLENNAVVYEVTTGNEILILVPTLGHLVDLPPDGGFYGVKVEENSEYNHLKFIPYYNAIKKCRDCNYQFTRESDKCPKCGSTNIYNAKSQIDVLRTLAYEAETVIIATDPDSEGEKIAWDVYNLVKPFSKEIYRAEFHEITKKAIMNALSNLRKIDHNLVKAQIVRRIEDRWIGFKLSEILQKRYKNKNLSAGRAQTPVLGWIVKLTEEHQKHDYFLSFDSLRIQLDENEIKGIIEKLNIDKKIKKIPLKISLNVIERNEATDALFLTPFTTDLMLNYASKILKFSPQKTMHLAQELFELGLITYHRTDSINVSEVGYNIAKELLKDDFQFRKFKSEGAHECIRPTKPWTRKDIINGLNEGLLVFPIKLTTQHLKLYDLILRRFLAALSNAKVTKEEIKAKINILDEKMNKIIIEKEVEFNVTKNVEGKGYELWPYDLKPQHIEEGIKDAWLIAVKKPLLTYADVINLMKTKEIGRPSTYATIISKLQQREYVKGEDVLWATNLGFRVFYFLNKNYSNFVSEERTKQLYRKMDLVEQAKEDYQELLKQVYEEILDIEKIKNVS